MEREYFGSLKANGWNRPVRDRMLEFAELNELLRTEDVLATGFQYDAGNFDD